MKSCSEDVTDQWEEQTVKGLVLQTGEKCGVKSVWVKEGGPGERCGWKELRERGEGRNSRWGNVLTKNQREHLPEAHGDLDKVGVWRVEWIEGAEGQQVRGDAGDGAQVGGH